MRLKVAKDTSGRVSFCRVGQARVSDWLDNRGSALDAMWQTPRKGMPSRNKLASGRGLRFKQRNPRLGFNFNQPESTTCRIIQVLLGLVGKLTVSTLLRMVFPPMHNYPGYPMQLGGLSLFHFSSCQALQARKIVLHIYFCLFRIHSTKLRVEAD